jgi:glycosyltransferase involved in cell wall biosynthesis
MISVAYDHQVFTLQQYGGVSRYFYELAKRVSAAQDFTASIVAPLHVNKYLAEGGVDVAGFRIPVIRGAGRIARLANRVLSPALLKFSRPDVLHETYYNKESIAPRGCPIVITVYDMIHEKSKDHFDNSDQTSAAKRAAVTRADRVICISERTRIDLIECFDPDPKKITTIHLGFSMTKTANPVPLPELPRPFFLFVGQRGTYKNFKTLLHAFASSSLLSREFDLIAFGTTAFTSQENESIRAAGMNSGRVRHLSGDDSLLGYLYGKAMAFIYPSLYEGFGIPPLEAMSFSCPVLCSDTSSIPEVVGDAGMYFDPTSADAIRACLERVISSDELRAEMISRGHNRVLQFSYDRCAAETLAVYRDLLQ